jgi:outer membrane scaffolding protein for murein synthesis (MipA/OmpV family)
MGPLLAHAEDDPARLEGAIGLLVRHGPTFAGSQGDALRASPAGFLRIGRYTLTGSGGFTTVADESVERGLAAEISRRGRLRLSLGLRLDRGRDAADDAELTGLGAVRRTVRARLGARWDADDHWRVGAGLSVDALGRGQGAFGDVSVARRWALGNGDSLWLAASVSAASRQHLQAWHGVTPSQSVASGLPVFEAHAGWRDAHLSATWRAEYTLGGKRLGTYLGLDRMRLLGAAAQSPITRRREATTLSAGMVWRF